MTPLSLVLVLTNIGQCTHVYVHYNASVRLLMNPLI